MNKVDDLISRQAAIEVLRNRWLKTRNYEGIGEDIAEECEIYLKTLPSAQSEQRYTKEELRVFQHGTSLSLLSKRSAQHWRYDEDTATEIKFLERLYDKVSADIKAEGWNQ